MTEIFQLAGPSAGVMPVFTAIRLRHCDPPRVTVSSMPYCVVELHAVATFGTSVLSLMSDMKTT